MSKAGTLTRIVFHIRDKTPTTGQTAEIYVALAATPTVFVATGIIASIVTGGSPCAFGTGSYAVAECDLVSVRVTTAGGAFSSGAAATITKV
jgi:hypothetical protein